MYSTSTDDPLSILASPTLGLFCDHITQCLANMSADKEDRSCTLTFPDGTHYDLNPLSSASADYEAQVGSTTYKLNVCRAVVSELWKVDQPDNVAGFVSRPEGDFSLG